jgi:hypothetical protein
MLATPVAHKAASQGGHDARSVPVRIFKGVLRWMVVGMRHDLGFVTGDMVRTWAPDNLLAGRAAVGSPCRQSGRRARETPGRGPGGPRGDRVSGAGGLFLLETAGRVVRCQPCHRLRRFTEWTEDGLGERLLAEQLRASSGRRQDAYHVPDATAQSGERPPRRGDRREPPGGRQRRNPPSPSHLTSHQATSTSTTSDRESCGCASPTRPCRAKYASLGAPIRPTSSRSPGSSSSPPTTYPTTRTTPTSRSASDR